jgi:hypothetical protein
MNKTLNRFIAIMGNQEAARNVAPSPPVSTALVITPLQALQPSRVELGVPSHFDGNRAQGCTFLTSCELYISLTASDFVDEQVRIHWALSYFKGGRVASFANVMSHIILTPEMLLTNQRPLHYTAATVFTTAVAFS